MKEFIVGNLYIELWEDWSELFAKDQSWRPFTLIHFYLEDEIIMGNFEVLISLLGFNVRFCYLYNPEAEARQKIIRQIQEFDVEDLP